MAEIESQITKDKDKLQAKLEKKINTHLKKLTPYKASKRVKPFPKKEREIVKYYIDWYKKTKIVEHFHVPEYIKKYQTLYDYKMGTSYIYKKLPNSGSSLKPLDYHVYPQIHLLLIFKMETIKARIYTAVCGETLQSISKSVYGSEIFADDIYKKNAGFKTCKIKNYVFAQKISMPEVKVPVALLAKQPTASPKAYLDLSFLDQTPSLSTTIKKVSVGPIFLVGTAFSIRVKGVAQLDLSAKRKNSKVPAKYDVQKDAGKFAVSLSKFDLGFSITDWSTNSLTCKSSVTTKQFKLSGKLSIDGAFDLSASAIPLSFKVDGWEVTGNMSLTLKMVIIPHPLQPIRVDEPYYQDVKEFITENQPDPGMLVKIAVPLAMAAAFTMAVLTGPL